MSRTRAMPIVIMMVLVCGTAAPGERATPPRASASPSTLMKEHVAHSISPSDPKDTDWNEGCSLQCAVDWKLSTTSPHDGEPVGKLDDGDCGTAWISNAKNGGLGERIVYSFPPSVWKSDVPGPINVSGFELVNGYIKTPSLWKAYGRISRIKIYLNDEPIRLITLLDTTDNQSVDFDPFWIKKGDSVSLEIVEVYPGAKHKQVAITELIPEGGH